MALSTSADVQKRLVIARIGWCRYYEGRADDPPRKGGSFNDPPFSDDRSDVDDFGSEHSNFLPILGDLYGWVKPPSSRLNVKRIIGADDDKDLYDDICVAWIATRTGFGQVLVGWYRHAKMHAEYRNHTQRGLYQFICTQNNGVLLHPDDRRLQIPKGKGATGQSNVTYARDDRLGKLIAAGVADPIRALILAYKRPPFFQDQSESVQTAEAIVRGQGFQHDLRYRRLIELHAMARVKQDLRQDFDEVHDHSDECSYDYLCRNNSKEVIIEVKGTTTAGDSVLLSRAECELAKRQRVDLYVVSDIIIQGNGENVKAVGGKLKVYKDWGSKNLPAKPLGYAVSLK